MAILYIGNGTAKKVDNLYIGIGGQAKKVTKGYIGVGGQAKLFYNSSQEIIKRVAYLNRRITNVVNIYYNTLEGYSYIVNTKNSDGYIWFSNSTYDYGYINTESEYIYLYSDSSYFLKDSFNYIINIEKLGFDYVTNIAYFRGASWPNAKRIRGQLDNINFNNVINAHNAFESCYNIYGNIPEMPNAINMSYTFRNCRNITGNPMWTLRNKFI